MTKGQRAVFLRDSGLTQLEIASALGMRPSSLRRLISETLQANLMREQAPLPASGLLGNPAGTHLAWSGQTLTIRGSGVTEAQGDPRLAGLPGAGSSPAKSRPTSHIVIPDTQCKPGVDLEHLRWAGKYIAEREPDVVVHLGDHWDMESLSEYDRGKKSFEGRRYTADIAAGNRGLEMLMAGIARCRRKPRLIFLRGNHEQRIERCVEAEPRLEGAVGYHDMDEALTGWEVQDFLRPITIDGVAYAHYFYQPNTGRSYSGSVDTMLRNIGHSFTMGHQQGLRWARRELPSGAVQIGLVAGSFYSHEEIYKGPQGNSHWRGIMVKHEVSPETGYDPMAVSLGYLKRRFA